MFAPEERFDTVTAYCQSRFGVQNALVTLVDSDRQWFKLGTLCLIDPMPKDLAPDEIGHLQLLARMVSQELEKAGSGYVSFK